MLKYLYLSTEVKQHRDSQYLDGWEVCVYDFILSPRKKLISCWLPVLYHIVRNWSNTLHCTTPALKSPSLWRSWGLIDSQTNRITQHFLPAGWRYPLLRRALLFDPCVGSVLKWSVWSRGHAVNWAENVVDERPSCSLLRCSTKGHI
jgi:hypothetical protein